MFRAAPARRVSTSAVLAATLLGTTLGAAEPDGAAGTLDLPDGGRLAGRLVAAPPAAAGARDTLLWQATGFASPFEFHLDAIRGARFRPAGGGPAGPWKILLAGGDAVNADLEAFDGKRVTVRRGGPRPQRLTIDREAIERIVRVGPNAAGGFVGPGGLAGWTQEPADAWGEEATGIRADVRGAAVERDVGGPVRAVYDVVLSWRRAPACRLAVAAAAARRSDPYQFEVFGDGDDETAEPTMVLIREEQDTAASEPLVAEGGRPDPRLRRLRVVLFVDQANGRMAVVLPERSPEPAADVTIPPPPDRAASGRFRLVSGGDIGLESLRVTEWRGERPIVERADRTALVRRDGGRETGELAPWEAADAELVVRGDTGDVRVRRDDVHEIVFAEPEEAEAAEPAVRATSHGAEVLRGDLVKVDEAAVWLRRAGIDEPVAVPLGDLVALESRREVADPRPLSGRLGRFRQAESDIRGALAPVGERVGFQPVGSVQASPFVGGPGSGAVVEYVEREAAGADAEVGGLGAQVNQDAEGFFVIVMMRDDGAAAIDGRIQPNDRIVAVAPEEGAPFVETKGLALEAVMNLLRGRIGTPVRLKVTAGDGRDPREVDLVRRTIHVVDPGILRAALAEHARLAPARAVAAAAAGFPAVLFLRTGDALPCAVDAIDATGIRIRTPLGAAARPEAVAIPARLVQAVEFVPAASRDIDRTRIERLLTLPRMQRANPPTHLVRLVDGDYLRGRVEGLDARRLTVALADAVKDLPRDTVARVIWLHPEDLDEPPADRPPAAGPDGLVVQGVAAGGERVTVDSAILDGTTIRGRHAAIGPAAIDTEAVDRLLIGAAIEAEVRDLPYQRWKLKPAPEPRGARRRGPPSDG